MSGRTLFTGRRTRLLPVGELNYRAVHSRIPDAVADALRSSGVVSWRIWQDGQSLFHSVETRAGYPDMVSRIQSLGPIDPDWDVLIASLLDSAPGSDVLLPLVWGMDLTSQWGNEAPEQLS